MHFSCHGLSRYVRIIPRVYLVDTLPHPFGWSIPRFLDRNLSHQGTGRKEDLRRGLGSEQTFTGRRSSRRRRCGSGLCFGDEANEILEMQLEFIDIILLPRRSHSAGL